MNNIPYKFHNIFSSPIWKTEISPDGGKMAFEIRDQQAHQAHFWVLDTHNFTWMLERYLLPEEEWWCGLSHIDCHALYVHVFDNQDNPDEKTLYQLAFQSNELKTVEPEILSGSLIHEGIQFPVFYGHDVDHFAEFREFIQRELNVDPQLGCDYMEYGNNIIISYYIRSTKGFECWMAVIDHHGSVILQETLEKSLTGVIGKPYFIVGDNLFFIKNKREICVYDLT